MMKRKRRTGKKLVSIVLVLSLLLSMMNTVVFAAALPETESDEPAAQAEATEPADSPEGQPEAAVLEKAGSAVDADSKELPKAEVTGAVATKVPVAQAVKAPEEKKYRVHYRDVFLAGQEVTIGEDNKALIVEQGDPIPAHDGPSLADYIGKYEDRSKDYDFAGWSKTPQYFGNKPNALVTIEAETAGGDKEDIVYYAQWKKKAPEVEQYRVHYRNAFLTNGTDNGADTIGETGALFVKKDDPIPAHDAVALQKYIGKYEALKDYDFAGWSKTPQKKGEQPHAVVDMSKETAGGDKEDIVYYAQWKKKEPVNQDVTITIRYFYKDETGKEVDLRKADVVSVAKGKYDISEKFPIPVIITENGEEYTLENPDGISAQLKGTAETDKTIEAEYKLKIQKVKLTVMRNYKAADGSVVASEVWSEEVAKGSAYDVAAQAPDSIEKDGVQYERVSVSGDLNGTAEKDLDITVEYKPVVAAIETVMVKWVDENGDVLHETEAVKGEAPEAGQYTELSKKEAPSKEADDENTYEFIGWSEGAIDESGNVTYTAQYKAVPIPPEAETATISIKYVYTDEDGTEHPLTDEPQNVTVDKGEYDIQGEVEIPTEIEKDGNTYSLVENQDIELTGTINDEVKEIVVRYERKSNVPVDPINPVDPVNPDNPVNPEEPATPAPPENPVGPAPGTQASGTTPAATTATPVAAAPAAAAPTAPAATPATLVPVADEAVPLANVNPDETRTAADEEVPLAKGNADEWALLNLILMILTALASGLMLVFYFLGRRNPADEEGEQLPANRDAEEERLKRKGLFRLLSIVPAVVSVIFFVLTEDMSNPMVFTDKWTLWMAVFALANAVLAIFAKKSRYSDDDTQKPDYGIA